MRASTLASRVPDSPPDTYGSNPRRDANWILASLPRAEWRILKPYAQIVQLTPTTFVRCAGGHWCDLYFPTSSVISISVPMASGDSACVAAVGREGMVGLSAWLGDYSAPYQLGCPLAGRAVRLPVERISAMSTQLPQFTRGMQRYLVAWQQHVARNVACTGLHSVEQRLACWLLLAGGRANSNTLSITHEILARMIGVRRPFLTHVFGCLERNGIVRHVRGSIEIIDPRALRAVACEDYEAIEAIYARLENAPISMTPRLNLRSQLARCS